VQEQFNCTAQTADESGMQHDIADMLVTDAEDIADFGAVALA
jgi:hypothetical protein